MPPVVAFLQNQWFKDPERARAVFERNPEHREHLISAYLFMGCLTGKRLEAAFGDLCDTIVWEECSRHIGGKSSSSFPADLDHMRGVLAKHAPAIVLTFGKIANDAVEQLCLTIPIISAPHPAARFGAIEGLKAAAQFLRERLSHATITK